MDGRDGALGSPQTEEFVSPSGIEPPKPHVRNSPEQSALDTSSVPGISAWYCDRLGVFLFFDHAGLCGRTSPDVVIRGIQCGWLDCCGHCRPATFPGVELCPGH